MTLSMECFHRYEKWQTVSLAIVFEKTMTIVGVCPLNLIIKKILLNGKSFLVVLL